MRISFKVPLLVVVSLVLSCIHPTTKVKLSENSGPTGIVVTGKDSYSLIKGYGTITYSENGNRQTGSFDVNWQTGNTFSAHFYSPFGTVLGSVTTDGDSGVIRFNSREHHVGLQNPVDLFFFCNTGLTMADVVTLLTGRIVGAAVMQKAPDSSFIQQKYHVQFWKSEKTSVSYFFSKDFRHLKRIVYNYNFKKEDAYSILFQSFFEGFSRYITLKADDRNYFSLKFEHFRFKK